MLLYKVKIFKGKFNKTPASNFSIANYPPHRNSQYLNTGF